jgi:hypothetical protein
VCSRIAAAAAVVSGGEGGDGERDGGDDGEDGDGDGGEDGDGDGDGDGDDSDGGGDGDSDGGGDGERRRALTGMFRCANSARESAPSPRAPGSFWYSWRYRWNVARV